MQSTLLLAFVLTVTSALTVGAVLLIAMAFRRPPRHRAVPMGGGDPAFMFDGSRLIDANARGRAVMDGLARHDAGDLETLAQFLAPDFPNLLIEINGLIREAPRTLSSINAASSLELRLDRRGKALCLTLVDTLAEDGVVSLDRLSYRAMQDELKVMRHLVDSAPFMLWREGRKGQVTWANKAYLHRLAQDNEILAWPLPPLFPPGDSGETKRLSLEDETGQTKPSWFDVNRVSDEGGQLAYAMPADEVQKAERAKRDFIQTLTKTFATLPIGLAVFDRARRLQMFNPALTDLTGLETEFLLSRPGLEGFLNRMRDKHILPEPRDYRSWARRLLDIETAAPLGDFEENWTLPSGQTYRVSTNPHPDGALAFLIEDITSETHMTRNVRAEMETSQSVLNQIDAAIAVFNPNGQLILTNTAFSRLWTLEGEDSLNAVTLPEALDNWREAGDTPQLWARVGALSRPGHGENLPVNGVMTLHDGERLSIDARRTTTGALMISFTQLDKTQTAQEQDSRAGKRAQILRASA